jgi:hypothetical protein
MAEEAKGRDPVAWGASVFAGFAFLALGNAIAIALTVPMPTLGLGVRLADHLFDAFETLGLGALGALATVAVGRWVRLPKPVMYVLLYAAALATIASVVGHYLALSAAHARNGQFEKLAFVNSLALSSFVLASAPVVAWHLSSKKPLRFVLVAAAAGALLVDQSFLRDDYYGIHGLIAVATALLAGPPLSPLLLRLRRRSGGRLVALAVFLAALGLGVPPPNSVRCELFRQPCAVAPWLLATFVWRLPNTPTVDPVPDGTGPVPPTSPAVLPANPVVVLITVDALRADVVNPPGHDGELRTFATLKRTGVEFTNASTPGTQTPVSLATMFSGRYFSEQRWETFGEGGDRYPYPAADTSPRFPELLRAAGVATVHEASFVFLANRFGVARGFAEENVLGKTAGAAMAAPLTAALLERLANVGDTPAFFYMHLAEPHAPYRLGPRGDDFHHYLYAITVADAQIGRVLQFLEEHLDNRWVLIVSSDHGEAFGDHETFEHAKTVYEELLHVPLLVRSPAFAARKVATRVGLVDLGPTVLDLFRQEVPASFHGVSLVPCLEGKPFSPTRPLLAEARLSVSLTQQDGFKVIMDRRRKIIETYDLVTDPKETRNLWDEEPGRSRRALASLRAFLAVHALRDGGYEPPYKP